MKRQKLLAALLSGALLAALAGCGAQGGGTSSVPDPPVSSAQNGSQSSSAGGADTGSQSGSASGTETAAFRMTQEGTVRNEKFREQEEFADFIAAAESRFLIPGLNQAMTPQGITFSEETGLVYISSYAIVEIPSVISAVNLDTGELAAEYYLFNEDGTPFTSHVGGVAVAEGNLYVSAKLDNDGSYSIAVLPMENLPVSGSHDITVEETIPLPVSPSFLNYSQGVLWVGTFYHPKGDYNLSKGMAFTTPTADGESGCYILGYDLGGGKLSVPEGERYPVPVIALVAPDKIQGVVALPDGESTTVWLSQSYGRGANSTLLAYQFSREGAPDTQIDVAGHDTGAYVLDSKRQTQAVTAMPMTEGLCLSREGGFLVLFESGSSRYSDGKYRTDHVWEMKSQG